MSWRFPPIAGVFLALLSQAEKATAMQPASEAVAHLQKTVSDQHCVDDSLQTQGLRPQVSASSELSSAAEDPMPFYVSPQGDDSWSGLLAGPNLDHTDGPFATITTARDAARRHGGQNTIAVGDGDYYLSQPIVFDARDAGLVVTVRCGQKAVLHGGSLVEGWTPQTGGRWIAPLKLPADTAVGDLFVNGVLQTQARFPNAPVDGDPQKGWLFASKCQSGSDAYEGNTRFCFHPGDLPMLEAETGLVVDIVGGFHSGSQWGSDTLPVVSIDAATCTIRTKGTGYFFTAEGSRYFVKGAKGLLDAPGEWWHDPVAGQISYMPAGPPLAGASVVAAVLPTFFRLDNADGMVISGLQFRDGAPQGSGKFATDSRGFGAIRLEHADNVKLLGNVIENVGVGIHVSESEDVSIIGNRIGGLAGNGIYLGTSYGSFGKSHGARILSNHIHDIGMVYFETAGIWFQAGDRILIADNLIENAAQFGIAGGSLWGAQDAVHDAVIERNVIRNANQQTADGGAVKMMGVQGDLLNSTIRDNLVTGTGHLMNRADGTFWPHGSENIDEWPSPISWAIYTDGRASGVHIVGNTLLGNVTGIGINGGWNNLVTGNTIANGSGTAFRVDDGTGRGWHPPWAQPNRIEQNRVSIDDRNGLAAYLYAPDLGAGYVRFVQNRYSGNLTNHSFRVFPVTMPSGVTGGLKDLQRAGLDSGSVVDPDPHVNARR
jgi:nitrous oxidase accessory protein NosD